MSRSRSRTGRSCARAVAYPDVVPVRDDSRQPLLHAFAEPQRYVHGRSNSHPPVSEGRYFAASGRAGTVQSAGGRSPGVANLRQGTPTRCPPGGAAHAARHHSQRAYSRSSVFISSNSSTMRSRYQSFPSWTMSVPRGVGVALSLVGPLRRAAPGRSPGRADDNRCCGAELSGSSDRFRPSRSAPRPRPWGPSSSSTAVDRSSGFTNSHADETASGINERRPVQFLL